MEGKTHTETTQGISDVIEQREIIKASRVGEKKNKHQISHQQQWMIKNNEHFFEFLIFKPLNMYPTTIKQLLDKTLLDFPELIKHKNQTIQIIPLWHS